MVGPDAPEIMQGVAIAMKAGATKAHFDSTVRLRPTKRPGCVTKTACCRAGCSPCMHAVVDDHCGGRPEPEDDTVSWLTGQEGSALCIQAWRRQACDLLATTYCRPLLPPSNAGGHPPLGSRGAGVDAQPGASHPRQGQRGPQQNQPQHLMTSMRSVVSCSAACCLPDSILIVVCMLHDGGRTHVSSGLVAQLLGHIHWLHICFGQEATILHVCMHITFGQTGAHLHGIQLFSVIDSQRQHKNIKAMQSIS